MTTKLRAASFQDNAVTTAKIAADAVTNAKIASGAVDTTELAADAVDNTILDLASNYAFTGTITGDNGGSMEVISSTTSNGNVSALEIDLSTDTKYAYQMLNIRAFASTSTADMYMQLRKQSNSSYITDSYLSIIGSHHQSSSSNSSGQNGNWNGSYFRMVHNGVTTDHTHQLNDMNIYFFNTANDKKFVVGADRFGQNTTGIMKEQMSGKGGYADVVDRLKLYMGSGNIVYDEYTLYGFLRS